jgi:hypothetical protein
VAVNGLTTTILTTLADVLPIAAILFGFQYLVLRRPFPHLQRILLGFAMVFVGLTLLLLGLEQALFPVGRTLIEELTAPALQVMEAGDSSGPGTFAWVYLFGALIAFAAVFAEPVLAALAGKAESVSGGAIRARGVRLAVALGAALGVALSILRMVIGAPLLYFVVPVVVLIAIQSVFTPAVIRPLAYDAGVAGTSTLMVPLLVAIGLALAGALPGRDPLADGFGIIILACLMPVVVLMAYAQLGVWWARRERARERAQEERCTSN